MDEVESTEEERLLEYPSDWGEISEDDERDCGEERTEEGLGALVTVVVVVVEEEEAEEEEEEEEVLGVEDKKGLLNVPFSDPSFLSSRCGFPFSVFGDGGRLGREAFLFNERFCFFIARDIVAAWAHSTCKRRDTGHKPHRISGERINLKFRWFANILPTHQMGDLLEGQARRYPLLQKVGSDPHNVQARLSNCLTTTNDDDFGNGRISGEQGSNTKCGKEKITRTSTHQENTLQTAKTRNKHNRRNSGKKKKSKLPNAV